MTYNNANIINKYENILKPLTDKREYRGIVLKNELKVLLISDKEAEKSAAALNVHVGHMSDPDEFPGLAHFCEHMLFLGTSKYPDENGYNKFISEHGGTNNAWTSTHETVYIFEIGTDYLKEALDRFAQFFIAPLFSQSATEREVNAVNSEHLKNVTNDHRRLHFVKKILCNPSHPYRKFSTGNKQTLIENPKNKGLDVQKALQQFHNQWYSSNIMTLAIIGKESLDDLEMLTYEIFSDIQNKNVTAPVWNENPYTSNEMGTVTKILPIKNIRSLNISFPFPDVRNDYKVGVDIYIKSLIGHEGPNSLLSYLKYKSWSSFLCAKVDHEFGFAFFNITIDLTEEGLCNVEKIVSLLFQYIKLLKSKGIEEWIYSECSNIQQLRFRYKDKETPFNNVSHVAHNLLLYPFEDVLIGMFKMTDYNFKLISDTLAGFNPDTVRIYIVAQLLEEACTDVEPIFGVKYHHDKISRDLLEKWKSDEISSDLRIPLPNEFIVSNLSLLALDNVKAYPEVVLRTHYLKVWFKQDSIFLIPKLNIKLKITSPFIYIDPLNYNLACLYCRLFKDSLNECTYGASLAGLDWHITLMKDHFTICVYGFSQHLKCLLSKILQTLNTFSINKERFAVIRENYIRELENFNMDQPYIQTAYYTDLILNEKSWSKQELLRTTDDITTENLEKFLPQLWSKTHVEVLIYGNCNNSDALNVAKIIDSTLDLKNRQYIHEEHFQKFREHKIENGKQYVFNVEHAYNNNSSTSVIYQCGTQCTDNNMLLELLVQIIRRRCFSILRTQEQLGYVVKCLIRRSNGTQDLRIYVQSEKNPNYLDSRIENFLDEMKDYIKSMTTEDFSLHKAALTVKRLEKPQTLLEWTNKYWSEIINQQCKFNRDAVEVTYLKNITKEQLLTFYIKTIEKDRRKLSIQIKSIESSNDNDNISKQSYNIISDIRTFKKSKELYALVK